MSHIPPKTSLFPVLVGVVLIFNGLSTFQARHHRRFVLGNEAGKLRSVGVCLFDTDDTSQVGDYIFFLDIFFENPIMEETYLRICMYIHVLILHIVIFI